MPIGQKQTMETRTAPVHQDSNTPHNLGFDGMIYFREKYHAKCCRTSQPNPTPRCLITISITVLLSVLMTTISVVLSRVGPSDISKNIVLEQPVSIKSLELIDCSENQKLVDLEDGMIVNLSNYGIEGIPLLSINASITCAETGSVLFSYNDDVEFQVENFAPLAMCGNFGEQIASCPELSQLGTHHVVVTPFSGKLLQGDRGEPWEMSFAIVNDKLDVPVVENNVDESPTDVPTLTERNCSIPKVSDRFRVCVE